MAKELEVLERARDTERGAMMRFHAREIVLAAIACDEADAARLRPIEAADTVQKAGLARAVGSDDSDELAQARSSRKRRGAPRARRNGG